MAGEFYQKAGKEQVSQLSSVKPTDMTITTANQQRAQQLITAFDSLGKLGSQALSMAQSVSDKKDFDKGVSDAIAGKESTEGGYVQEEAFNTMRARVVTSDMPSYIQQNMANYKDADGKPFVLDEATPDKRRLVYNDLRNKFFQERGVRDSQYAQQAILEADLIQQKQLTVWDNQANELRQAKAESAVQLDISTKVASFGGAPSEIDATIAENRDLYASSMGSAQLADEAIARGLMQSVMNANPNLQSLTYLKSEEAKKRFGHLENFEQMVGAADRYSTKQQNDLISAQRNKEESLYYQQLSTGAFGDIKQVTEYLNGTGLDEKTKFSLTNKAAKHLEVTTMSDSMQAAVNGRQFNIVNSAKREVLEASFARNVGSKTELDFRNLTDVQKSRLQGWIEKGFNVPSWISSVANSPINNGDKEALDTQLIFYSELKKDLGESGAAAIFNPETKAKLDYYARLSTDSTISDVDRKRLMDEFDKGAEQDMTGISFNQQITKELTDDSYGIQEDITKWAREGGSNILFGSNDMQPFFSFGSSDSQDYAVKELQGNYAVYRRAGYTSTEALDKAKGDFQARNIWVDWDKSGRSTYIPKQFGEDFSEKGVEYIQSKGIVQAIALDENLDVEDVEKRIYIQPSSDYTSTRQMSVFLDGRETSYKFDLDKFKSGSELLREDVKNQILEEYNIQRNSPQFKQKKQQIQNLQKALQRMKW